jgi:hypothetical protein
MVLAFVVGLFIQPLDSQANPSAVWQVSFFDNTKLAGEPILSRSDRDLDFNWAMEAPAPTVPTDQFSARWTGNFHFDAGEWLFSAGADDGIRLWVDDELLVDQWEAIGAYVVHIGTTQLEDDFHDIKVEYYDADGLAGITLNWKRLPDAENNNISDSPPQNPAPQSGPTPIPSGAPIANVTTGVLNVRVGPGIQFERIDQIRLYQRYPILGQSEGGSWYLIDLKDGRTGWVSSRFILRTGGTNIPVTNAGVPVPPSEQIFDRVTATSESELNIRPAPNTNNERIGILPYQAEFTVLGRSNDSIWYLVHYTAEEFTEDGESTVLLDYEGWVFAPYVDLLGYKVYDLPFVE